MMLEIYTNSPKSFDSAKPMNIHETAELIGPPSCIIALDWSEPLGARLDPGERREPDSQRRAAPSAGRTPRRPRRPRRCSRPRRPAPASSSGGSRARRGPWHLPSPFSAPRRGGARGRPGRGRRGAPPPRAPGPAGEVGPGVRAAAPRSLPGVLRLAGQSLFVWEGAKGGEKKAKKKAKELRENKCKEAKLAPSGGTELEMETSARVSGE